MLRKLKVLSLSSRDCIGIIAGSLVLIASVWLLTLERVGYERDEAEKSVVRQNTNLAMALEEQTTSTIKQVEQALLFLRHEYEDEGGKVLTLAQLSAAGIIDEKAFAALLVVDEQGYVVLDNGKRGLTKLADREFFSFHRDRPWDGTRISAPVFGRMTGREVIPITRRINGPEGAFRGVYIAGLDPHYLLSAYGKFDLGRAGLIQLVSEDGFALARRAGDTAKFGEDMRRGSMLKYAAQTPNGSFVGIGQFDGTARYISYRTIPQYRLVVAVGMSIDDALAEFRESARGHYLSAVAATMVLLLAAAGLVVATFRRNRAVAALTASEAVHRATFEQDAIGIVHVSLDGRFLRANRKFCRMLGYEVDELRRMRFADLTHPEDRESSFDAATRVLASPEASLPAFEKRYVRKDGRVLSASLSIALARKGDGAPDYFITMVEDITGRREAEAALSESERRFGDMMARIDLISLMLDRDARITYCNDYFLHLTGWRREEVIGRDWFEVFAPPEDSALPGFFEHLIADHPDATHRENEIRTRDGGRRMIHWNNSVLRAPTGEVIGTASIGEDITARKRAEAQLLEQLDELRRFQQVTVDRELRMIEIESELRELRQRAAA